MRATAIVWTCLVAFGLAVVPCAAAEPAAYVASRLGPTASQPAASGVQTSPSDLNATPMVRLEIMLLEVSLTKLRSMGFDYSALEADGKLVSGTAKSDHNSTVLSLLNTANVGKEAPTVIALDGNSPRLKVLEALIQNKTAQVLSRPQVMTPCGQAASMIVGGDEGRTELNVLPRIVNQKLRLELGLRRSEPGPGSQTTVSELEAGWEADPGQTVALELKLPRAGEAADSAREEVAIVALVCPQLTK